MQFLQLLLISPRLITQLAKVFIESIMMLYFIPHYLMCAAAYVDPHNLEPVLGCADCADVLGFGGMAS